MIGIVGFSALALLIITGLLPARNHDEHGYYQCPRCSIRFFSRGEYFCDICRKIKRKRKEKFHLIMFLLFIGCVGWYLVKISLRIVGL
jgi:hypothetical protein